MRSSGFERQVRGKGLGSFISEACVLTFFSLNSLSFSSPILYRKKKQQLHILVIRGSLRVNVDLKVVLADPSGRREPRAVGALRRLCIFPVSYLQHVRK